ncbi:GNAT family N-acetyltransferase [Evansella sp. LMS18]|jgi:ElaA protein|uniref:GNAT family N-acetyltransferase n=1 Tax=Evansella sp. LMS18 TaxID=2924033 RepID=UPI0020D03959|nr:GNAT family N-acetyltransferase [Evansella sp. LMS18]UTR08930.1 GNAT family N-acetyltransferase [Evansella sp. LMS18]
MEWKLKKFEEFTADELYRVLKQRVDVFVVEQDCPYPELDDHDRNAYHLFKVVNGEIAAYSRLLPRGTVYEEASIGRVLVNKEFRKQGLGRELLERSMDFLQNELEENKIKLQAQEYLRDFYASFGFKPVSEVYLEDGIPHVDMIYTKQ